MEHDIDYPDYSADMEFSAFGGGRVFDCDFHLYETADAFTRYLPDEHKHLVKLVEVALESVSPERIDHLMEVIAGEVMRRGGGMPTPL